MIYIDENDPEEDLEPYFPSKDVTIKYNTNPKELYDIIKEIGRGKFGTVYLCTEKSTGLKLAVKHVPIPKREDRRNVEREVEIMNELKHNLIIQLYAAYEYQKMMYVIQEIVEGGELFDRVIDDEFVLTEKACTVFVRQICEAMQFIHSKYILHLDLKPENILCLTKDGNRIKIIDFGLARKYDPEKKLQILFGTPEFVAPEVVNFDCISYGTDMWSVGVICYVLLSGLSPFMGETDLATMANVTIAKYDFDDEAFVNVSSEALDFISKLLVKELSQRMTATEALEHKWLKRPPKPPVSPKPTMVPPIKFKNIGPPPLFITDDLRESLNEKELEQAKDNLKSFIERWEEHPNSPYVFDSESNLIVPLRDNKAADSINSSRVCSPSPCESISSIADEEMNASREDLTNATLTPSSSGSFNFQRQSSSDNEPLTPAIHRSIEIEPAPPVNKYDQDFKDYLQSFERRNSDTNYLLGRRPSGEKVNLADEIKKLSQHLLMLAEINNKLGQEVMDDEEELTEEPITSNNKNTLNNLQTLKTEQKLSNSDLPKLRSSFERQISAPASDRWSNSRYPLTKSLTIKNELEKSKNSFLNDREKLYGREIYVSSKQTTFKPTEKEDLLTSSTKTFKSNEDTHSKLTQSQNEERRLSDAQTAAITISNFVQISKGKERASQQTMAQYYKQQQREQHEKYQRQQKNSFINNREISSVLTRTIDDVPKLSNGMKETSYDQGNYYNKREQNSRKSYIINGDAAPLDEFKYSTQNIESKARTSTLNGYINSSSKTLTTKQVSSIKQSIESNRHQTSSYANGPSGPTPQRRMSSSIASIFEKFSSENALNDDLSANQFRIGVPWAMHTKKRTKFRINESSRDVPIGSPDTHQTYNLEEAANQTKNCLLHLLEKYNETKKKGNHPTLSRANSRHQSISVDWSFSQDLENQSMSSINTFFQKHAIAAGNVRSIQAQLESKNDRRN